MYGDCQVLMSLLPSAMGGGPTGENNLSLTTMMMPPPSSSSSNFHHHGHGLLFSPPIPLRNPNCSSTTTTMGFNFMAADSIHSFNPFPTFIPGEQNKEEISSMSSEMTTMLGLRGGRGFNSKDEILDVVTASASSQLEFDVNGGDVRGFSVNNKNAEHDISGGTQYLIEHNMNSNHQDDQREQQVLASAGNKKKRYHRHTARQIQELEAMFKECPHPDEKQRLRLSQELGLKPTQVKFWFQNRRTQMKAQHDRADNMILRSENDSLKTENYKLAAMMRSLMCPNCGNSSILGEVTPCDMHQLRHENDKLKEELDRLCNMVSRYSSSSRSTGPPLPPILSKHHHVLDHAPSLDLDMNIYSRGHFQEPPPSPPNQMTIMPTSYLPDHTHYPSASPIPGDEILLLDEDKQLAMELALSSLDELLKMCRTDEPLWVRNSNNNNTINENDGGSSSNSANNVNEVLNVEEYTRMFPWSDLKKPPCRRREATRHSALVIMNSVNLVDAFLDADKWIELFPSIVSRAKTIQNVGSDHSNARGSLHLMYAELQVVSPLVPTREVHFFRYCHHNPEDGMWMIVDFPLDDNFRCTGMMQQKQFPAAARYRRRPSGCIIQDMPNGYSKVTWVEHGEILEEKPVPQVFNNYVTSGMAYSAHRWLAVLQRQCESVATQMARNISDIGVIQSAEARKNLMRLAHRMTRLFCVNMSSSCGQSWTSLPDSAEETVRITTRQVTEPGQPIGMILCAALTKRLPYSPDNVFNFLKNEHNRSRLEAFSHGNLHEVAHIANGSDPGNSVSLLRINVASNSAQNLDLMLQETCTDTSNRLIVYTTLQVNYIQQVMSGYDPFCIPLLPVGFSITPLNQQHSVAPPPVSVSVSVSVSPTSTSTTTCSNNNVLPTTTTTTTNNNTSSSNIGSIEKECLLTVGLQAHASSVPSAKISLSSIAAMNDHLCSAVSQINAALLINAASTSSDFFASAAPAPAAGKNVINFSNSNNSCSPHYDAAGGESGGDCLHAHNEEASPPQICGGSPADLQQ